MFLGYAIYVEKLGFFSKGGKTTNIIDEILINKSLELVKKTAQDIALLYEKEKVNIVELSIDTSTAMFITKIVN